MKTRRVALLGLCCVALAAMWAAQLVAEFPRLRDFRESRRRAATAVQFINVVPENPDLVLAYPYQNGFRERVNEMQQLGATRFNLAPASIAERIATSPAGDDASGGHLDRAVLQGDGMLRVIGWARNARTGGRADYVILGWQQDDAFHPMTVIRAGKWRGEFAATSGSSTLSKSGFDQAIEARGLPAGRVKIKAWAVDVNTGDAFPLSGSGEVEPRRS